MISGTCRRGVSGTQPCECHRCQPPVFLARRAPRTSAAAHTITQETLVTPNTDQWVYSSLTTPKTSSKSDHESGDLHKTAICPGVHLHRDTKGKNQQTRGVNLSSKYVTRTQQQRPESPAELLTWHVRTYKVHKLHQKHIL